MISNNRKIEEVAHREVSAYVAEKGPIGLEQYYSLVDCAKTYLRELDSQTLEEKYAPYHNMPWDGYVK